MSTIKETIEALRAKREANSQVREKLRLENVALSKQIVELEAAITPPKKAKFSPDDKITVLKVEAANIAIAPLKLGK